MHRQILLARPSRLGTTALIALLAVLATLALRPLPASAGHGDPHALNIHEAHPVTNQNTSDQAEGNSGEKQFTFYVSLFPPSNQRVTVDYVTVSDTATVTDGDFDFEADTLVFEPGEVLETITVAVNGDTKDERDERFYVILSDATNATIVDDQATGHIRNDDNPVVSINDITNPEGNSGITPFVFTISLDRVSNDEVTVNYATRDGTGQSGATGVDPGANENPTHDFRRETGTVTFAVGETEKQIDISVFGDNLDENTEDFFVDITLGAGESDATLAAGGGREGKGTIENDDGPNLTISDASVTEGGNATFTVTLHGTTAQQVTVEYETEDGSAKASTPEDPPGSGIGGVERDYEAQEGVLTFPVSTNTSQSQTITIVTNDDTADEFTENFFVVLSNPNNAEITDRSGEGTILDNDDPPIVTINDVTENEGDRGTTPFVFDVTLSTASEKTVTVRYATGSDSDPDTANATPDSDGDRTTDDDYAPTSGELTFAPGETAKTITVDVYGDSADDNAAEYFLVTLSQPTNATFGDDRGQARECSQTAPSNSSRGCGQITDDDDNPGVFVRGGNVNEGHQGEVNLPFHIRLSAPALNPVTVNWETKDGTALAADDDYDPDSGTVTFQPGETQKTVNVRVNGDTVEEHGSPPGSCSGGRDCEYLFVEITLPDGEEDAEVKRESDRRGRGDIFDDDPAFSVSNEQVREGDDGQRMMTFTISIPRPSGEPTTVEYSTREGSADAGSDYVHTEGTATIPAEQESTTVDVPIIGDTVTESDEDLFLDLSEPSSGSTIDDATGRGVIVDDDRRLSISDASPSSDEPATNGRVREDRDGTIGNDAWFTVSLDRPLDASEDEVTVDWATQAVTVEAADYEPNSGTLTFQPGQQTRMVRVELRGDTTDEYPETFRVVLSGANNASIGDGVGVARIIDNDQPPSVSISDARVIEGDRGDGNKAEFVLTLSEPSGKWVSVVVATGPHPNQPAAAGSDYRARTDTVHFRPADTRRAFRVAIVGDDLNEPNERFTAQLSGAQRVTINDGSGIAVIVDDD